MPEEIPEDRIAIFHLGGEAGPWVSPRPTREKKVLELDVEDFAKQFPDLESRLYFYNYLKLTHVSDTQIDLIEAAVQAIFARNN